MDDILTEEEILNVTKKNLGHDSFKLIEFKIRPAGDSPLGFNGEHLKVEVKVSINNQNKSLYYFMKRTPNAMKPHQEYLEKARVIFKEVGLYKSLLIDLTNASISHGRVKKWFPESYYCKGDDAIVFEDVSVIGYYMYPERTILEEDYVLLCLDSMAAMHGSALIFEEKLKSKEAETLSMNKGLTIGELYSHLLFETEASGDPSHPGHWFYETGIKAQVELVDLLPKFTADEKIKIKELLPGKMRRIYDLVKPSNRYRNVLVHADLWTNNIMFKNNEKGKVEHALIVDFQLARYAPPAHDISMFLYLVQTREFRDKKTQEMLKYYYEALAEELEANGLKVEKLLPWDELLESYRYYEELALLTAFFYFQMILAPAEYTKEILTSPEAYSQRIFEDRNEMIKKCFLTDEIFRSRMTEAMDEFIRKYILI